MANKSGLAPIVLIELQPRCDRSSEPFRWIPFIALKIRVGEIEVKRGREYKAVFIGNLRQKTERDHQCRFRRSRACTTNLLETRRFYGIRKFRHAAHR